jgi:hypothetical protein
MQICPKCNRLKPTDSTVVVSSQGWHSINWFNPTTLLCLFHARHWISNVIYIYVVVFFVFNSLRWQVDFHFLEIGGIVYLRYLIFHKKASTSHSIHRLKLTYSLYDVNWTLSREFLTIYLSVWYLIQISTGLCV